ncbi:MAG: hypothetical protein EXR69_00460 [Myxococcales bacterium]|nr:hypothetical protein [Myxococcales bacterium]
MLVDPSVFCVEPQPDEATVELTAEAPLPAAPSTQPPVMTDFDWLERSESDALLSPFEINPEPST